MDVTLIDHNRESGRCPSCGEVIEVSGLACRFCHATFDAWAAREAVGSYTESQHRIGRTNDRKAWVYGAGALVSAVVGWLLYWGLRFVVRWY